MDVHSFDTAGRMLQGIRAANVMRKGQSKRPRGRNSTGRAKFTEGSVRSCRTVDFDVNPFALYYIFATPLTSHPFFDSPYLSQHIGCPDVGERSDVAATELQYL